MHPERQRRPNIDPLFPDVLRHLPSPRFLYGVYVLIAIAFGKYRVIYRTADSKGKLQLTAFQFGSGEEVDGVGEEALGGTLRQAAIVQVVRARDADTARAIHVDSVTVNVDHAAGNPLIGQLQIRGYQVERGRIILGRSKIVEVC